MQSKLVQRRPLLPCCLLLLLAEEPGHGYELTERLKNWGFELSGPGPVYRELRILEETGLVSSAWSEPQSGPVPRIYELTDAGRESLARAATEMADLERLLDDFKRRFRQLPEVKVAPPAPAAAPAPAPAPAAAPATAAAGHVAPSGRKATPRRPGRRAR